MNICLFFLFEVLLHLNADSSGFLHSKLDGSILYNKIINKAYINLFGNSTRCFKLLKSIKISFNRSFFNVNFDDGFYYQRNP